MGVKSILRRALGRLRSEPSPHASPVPALPPVRGPVIDVDEAPRADSYLIAAAAPDDDTDSGAGAAGLALGAGDSPAGSRPPAPGSHPRMEPERDATAGLGRQASSGDLSAGAAEPVAAVRPARRSPPVLLAVHDPDEHARRLLQWLLVDDDADPNWRAPDTMLADEMMEAYGEMCLQIGWLQRPWNPVAKHLAEMTGGKRYAWVVDEVTGKKSRRRVYRLRAADAGSLVPPGAAGDVAAAGANDHARLAA